jgi:hypothetical protein
MDTNSVTEITNREGPAMTKGKKAIKPIKEVLVKLAGEIPDVSSLEQAQYAYRKMIYFAGLKILEAFPEAVIGPDPSSDDGDDEGHRESAGRAPPGPHIYAITPGPHINHICGPLYAYGITPGPHINVIKIVDLVLCLNCPD